MADFEIVPGLRFIDRNGWGADTNLPRLGRRVDRDQRDHVIIHHTVIIDGDSSPNLWETDAEVFRMMRRLQIVRRDDLGADVPYSFVIFLMNNDQEIIVCEGRGEDRSGAHTGGGNHNTRGIGISFAGNFEDEAIDSDEIERRMPLVSQFLGWLKFSASHPDYGDFPPMTNLGDRSPSDRAVFFHQDFKATACPGEKLVRQGARFRFTNPG